MLNLEIAKTYRSLGWNVLPGYPHNALNKDGKPEKRPRLAEWKSLQNKMLDESKFEQLFVEGINIGMLTGAISGIDVLDLDSYKKNYWEEFGKMDGFKVETPLQVITQGGGKHLYFAHTEGLANAANSKIGIDFKADGGFVMLPPSYFDPKRPYKWVTEPTKEIIETLPKIPEWIVKKILKPDIRSYGYEKSEIDVLEKVPEGGRDMHLFKKSCHYLRKFGLSENGKKEAWLMVNTINEKCCEPPFSESYVRDKFNSGIKSVELEMAQKAKTEEAVELNVEHPGIDTQIDIAIQNYLNPGKGDISTGFPMLDEAMGGIKYGQSYLFFADTDVGKSVFMLNLLVNLDRNGVKSVYFDLENPFNMTLERLCLLHNKISKTAFNLIKNTEKVIPLMENLRGLNIEIWDLITLDDKVQGELNWDAIKNIILQKIELGYSLFVIDHLHYFNQTNDGFSYLGLVSKEINDICAVHNVVILMLAHTNKGESRRGQSKTKPEIPNLNNVYGSAMITKHTKNAIAFDRCHDSDIRSERELVAFKVRKSKSVAHLGCKLNYNENTLVYTDTGIRDAENTSLEDEEDYQLPI